MEVHRQFLKNIPKSNYANPGPVRNRKDKVEEGPAYAAPVTLHAGAHVQHDGVERGLR